MTEKLQQQIEKVTNNFMKMLDEERSKYHLTLGELIKALEQVGPKTLVQLTDGRTFHTPHSYRGYYSDLAFMPTNDPNHIMTAEALLHICSEAYCSEFEGYKGGKYLMTSSTPLWISDYGESSSEAIIYAQSIGDRLFLITKDIEV